MKVSLVSQKNLVRASLSVLSATMLFTYMPKSFAEGGDESSNGYKQPMGEQPDFNKKYRPNVPNHDFVLELNPLLLIYRSIAVELEKKAGANLTFGGDLIYRDALVYDEKDLKGRVQFLGVAPKVRFYPFQALDGFFFGGKLSIGQTNLSIKSSDVKSEKGVLTISPTAHVGYRLSTDSGFTMAAYIGGGVNIPKPELSQSDLKEENRNAQNWKDGRDAVNEASGLFKPDFGLTLGVSL
jgi:hypothetical protein